MKGIVVYYSATGNTKKIAKAIYKGMKGAMEKVDIADVKDVDPKDMKKYDVIGIGSPIWYFRETANVRLFIYNMPKLDGKLCFVFCSHGASPSGVFFSMVPALQKKGLTIIGDGDWYGSVYQVLHAAKPYFTDGHPDAIDLKEAEEFGRRMAENAKKIAAGDKSLIPDLKEVAKENSTFRPFAIGNPFPDESGHKGDLAPKHGPPPKPDRRINMSKCKYPECTVCVDNCPAKAIDFSKDPAEIRKSCFNCSLCDRICPHEAIGIPPEGMKRHRTMKVIDMKKCKYPTCKLCVEYCPMNSIDFSVNPPVFKSNCEGDDLCWIICPEGAIEITNLEETHGALYRLGGTRADHDQHPFMKLLAQAEREGKFRRHVPLDKIGWDTPVMYMKNHPRFDIHELMEDDKPE
jgi:flavodoxin/ferredoxin